MGKKVVDANIIDKTLYCGGTPRQKNTIYYDKFIDSSFIAHIRFFKLGTLSYPSLLFCSLSMLRFDLPMHHFLCVSSHFSQV